MWLRKASAGTPADWARVILLLVIFAAALILACVEAYQWLRPHI